MKRPTDLQALKSLRFKSKRLWRGDRFKANAQTSRLYTALGVADRVNHEPPEEPTMSREADKVSNVLSGVEALEKRAEEVGRKVSGAFDELHDAFNMAEQYGDAVSKAAGKIKGFLRLQTNSPPIEDAQIIGEQPALPKP